MPLWNLYCNKYAYSLEDKRSFAEAITDIYASVGMPRFYVSVVFHELPRNSLFIGGVPRNSFVRISIDHIARTTLPENRQEMLTFLNKYIDPFVRDRGSWERCWWHAAGRVVPTGGMVKDIVNWVIW